MAKISKALLKLHNQALDLVHSDRVLTWDERFFILENYQEGATQMNGLAGAFFTPPMLARDAMIEVNSDRTVLDLCAGIGGLSFWLYDNEITCVELNHDYLEVGKRVVPHANWIQGDALSYCDETSDRFDFCISNPPFGNINTSGYKGVYTGAEFEYKLIEAASKVSEFGVFIIPQQSAGFKYSGVQSFCDKEPSNKYKKFTEQTGIRLDPGCGVDTSIYLNDWNGVSPLCEIVTAEFY
ncbi:hypothetical protein ASwh1_324 [Aeromonas phage Aswh_1]|nr:hypothetical protein ASwh1_324 [Aeromonas phage Aswh_1]